MGTKSRLQQVTDFVDRWLPEHAGRFAVLLNDGQRIVIQDCHLSRDQADRADRVWVNHDSPEHPSIDFDLLDVASIVDLDQHFEVVSQGDSGT